MKKIMRSFAVILAVLAVFIYADTGHRFPQKLVRGERHIVVVITSYNNAAWCKRNLDSIFDQKYENYSVIYIDDASTDGTYDLVSARIKERGQDHRVAVFRNEKNTGSLYGIYHAIHACDDKTIIATVDGDDWLKHDNVLSMVNEAYDDKNVLLTYGQYEEYPEWKLGQCRDFPQDIIEKSEYRRYYWYSSQLRTFYAALFKRIRKEDLQVEGEFFKVGGDLAFMFPMLEMAGGRMRFISTINYVYNQTPFNDFRIHRPEQYKNELSIRSKPRYQRLSDEVARAIATDW